MATPMDNARVNRDMDRAARAEKHRAKARESDKRREESFARSDTDGFASQAASGLMAGKESLAAEIVEDGDRALFVGLYEGNVRVSAKLIDAAYGRCWLLTDDEAERFGRRFMPHNARSRIQKKHGLREAMEWAPAYAAIGGGGRGMAGMASCYVTARRQGDWYGEKAELDADERLREIP